MNIEELKKAVETMKESEISCAKEIIVLTSLAEKVIEIGGLEAMARKEVSVCPHCGKELK